VHSAKKTVKVAAVQAASILGDIERNTKKLTRLCKEAALNGAKIIVLPELSVTGYLSQDNKTNWHLPDWPLHHTFKGKDPLPFAQSVPGPATDHFASLAKELNVYITVPLMEIEGDKVCRLYIH